MTLWLPALTLVWREILRFYRQPSREAGALMQPVLMWVVVGAGLNASFKPAGMEGNFLDYFLPGIMLVVLLFTAIFSTISIIEDRKEGFLQGVLVAPVSPAAIVLGKVLGGALLGLVQASLLLPLLLLPQVSLTLTFPMLLVLLGVLFAVGAGLTTLGVLLAWPMDSMQGYHAIMMVVLFPLWFLSGAVFPAAGAPAWLAWPIALNPMSHALALVRACFQVAAGHAPATNGLIINAVYFFGFSGVIFVLAMIIVRRRG